MAKKKKSIDLSAKNIAFECDEGSVKIIRFNPNTMEVDVNIHKEGESIRSTSIPFAHLPKPIKKQIRPLS